MNTREDAMKECSCGSGLPREPLKDAREIFVAYVCDECREKVKSKYRPDIFTDSDYEVVDEDIDPNWFCFGVPD